MPIFVARQWIRHRTASLNEMSARYTELPDEMFVPEVVAMQSKDNKQGRDARGVEPHVEHAIRLSIAWANDKTYSVYEELLKQGVAREIARGVLPVNVYTKFVWKMDLHNLMHFLDLRLDPHAQKEIRDFAEVIEKLVALHFPLSYEAFVDYVRDAYTCSRMEIDLIREILSLVDPFETTTMFVGTKANMSKRELDEFKRKFFDE
jgi:thymidylate synthase (FAD)